MPIVLHGILGSPPCLDVLLVAKAINVPITFELVDMDAGQHKTDAYMKLNPAHSVPTLDDNGLWLWESRAIVTYLIDQYSKDDDLYPKDPKQRARIDNMLYFDACSLYTSIVEYFYMPLISGKTPDPDRLATLQDKLGIFERILSHHPYAAGDKLTVADLCLLNTMTVPTVFHFSLTGYPNITKWGAKLMKEVSYFDEVTKQGREEMKTFVSATKK